MSEVLGRLNRTIEAQGPDQLLVEARDALAAAYQTISDIHASQWRVMNNQTEPEGDLGGQSLFERFQPSNGTKPTIEGNP